MESPWVQRFEPRDEPRIRLIAFPHAGGAAHFFRPWAARLAADVELVAVQLPGRWSRASEALAVNIAHLLPALAQGLAPVLDKPCVLFGHSLGALLAYALTRQLQMTGLAGPRHVVVSAYPAPHLITDAGRLLDKSDQALVAELRNRYQGLPPEVLAAPELLALMLPVLRADLSLAATYHHAPGPPLACPILAVGGAQDPITSPLELAGWRMHTSAGFAMRLFAGAHFYLQEHHQQQALLALLDETLRPDE